MRVLRLACAVAALGASAMSADAQRRPNSNGMQRYFGNSGDFYDPPDWRGNTPYDGRFTFVRIKYRGFKHFTNEGPGWAHDYPWGETNFVKILRDISVVRPFVENGPMAGSVLLSMDDSTIFKYPVSYLSEPGGWDPNEKEVANLRKYLLKGGFMIFDDFREGWRGDYDFTHLRQIVGVALPGAKWVQLTGKEPIFDSFFKIDLAAAVSQTNAYGTNLPSYWGIYQDNDPKKRLIVIANVDNDIGDSWQWSATGFDIVASNEIYKLGVNYIIYALTH
ncbi:MAG TPA: DUF4159 domain-containing protein [Gemmatimonadaceae bacterium]